MGAPYVIEMPQGGFVLKKGGWNLFVRQPKNATLFSTKEDAEAGKPGHHRDMGGSGFKGRILSYQTVRWMDDRRW